MSAASAAVLTLFQRAPRPRDRCAKRVEPQDPAAHTTSSAGEPGVNAGGSSLRACQGAQQSPHEQLPPVRGIYRHNHGQSHRQSYDDVVFPKETKEFPSKLSASGWDIGEKRVHPTTGFSGTNDSRRLLTLEMTQLGPVDQKHTKALVIR